MLSGPDESLRHQLPTTFDHVGTSDPRFYDRYFFCAYDPDGEVALHIGLAHYSNMNVFDGYVTALVPTDGSAEGGAARPEGERGRPTEQRNVRLSRALRPDIDTVGVGPLSAEILEPFTRTRVRCEPSDLPVALDLEWEATSPAKEEDHHFRRLRGRVTTDYRRYTIVGRLSGTVDLGDRSFTADNWFAARDHSWGVREQVAGPEPVTGPEGFGLEQVGYVFYWMPFQCGDLAGHVQLQMLGDGTVIYKDGILYRGDGSVDAVVDVELDVEFFPGTRQFSRIRAIWRTASGQNHEVISEPLLRPFSMDGTGYDWGWDDGQGLGVYRGEYYTEVDTYDLSDPELVLRPDGEGRRPMHRETPATVWVDGVQGQGHQILVVTGPVTVLPVD